MLADLIFNISAADAEVGLFVLTATLVGVTVVLAYLTWKNVNAANRLIELQAEPFVYIDANWASISPDPQHLILGIWIKNRGGGPARDIESV